MEIQWMQTDAQALQVMLDSKALTRYALIARISAQFDDHHERFSKGYSILEL